MLCILCQCEEVAQLDGFPMCAHHQQYDEEGPPCPKCNPKREDEVDDDDIHLAEADELGMDYAHRIIWRNNLEDFLEPGER
jgi:hypothetical protein